MELVKRLFDKALVLKLKNRTDNRGPMTITYNGELTDKCGFSVNETRCYTMSKKGTFFGIHYREECSPMDERIGLKLEIPVTEIADYDKEAPLHS